MLEMYSIIRFFLVFFLLNLSVNVFANQPVVRFRNKTIGILAEGGADVFISSENVTITGDLEVKTGNNDTVNITEKVDLLVSLQNDIGQRVLHLAQRKGMDVVCNPEGTEYRERDFETGEFGACVCKTGRAGVACEALQESIPDATFHAALANCLAEAPNDGLCMTYGFITTKYGLMPDWNVSQVKDMSGYDFNTYKIKAFGQSLSFNGNISRWDVSQVTNMNCLFYHALSFNQDISRWSTSRVTDLGDIFSGSKFDMDINAWDVSSVTNMWGAFRSTDFNRNISSWDTSKVKNMGSMFKSNRMFNHYIGGWNTSSLTNFQYIFEGAVAFQAKYTCVSSTSNSVNPSSCKTVHSTWIAPPPPAS